MRRFLQEASTLRREHLPISTWDAGDEEMIEAPRIINTAPKPLLLHCHHGADRTGLTVAMYRMIFQGWRREDAKEELVNGGYGFHSPPPGKLPPLRGKLLLLFLHRADEAHAFCQTRRGEKTRHSVIATYRAFGYNRTF